MNLPDLAHGPAFLGAFESITHPTVVTNPRTLGNMMVVDTTNMAVHRDFEFVSNFGNNQQGKSPATMIRLSALWYNMV